MLRNITTHGVKKEGFGLNIKSQNSTDESWNLRGYGSDTLPLKTGTLESCMVGTPTVPWQRNNFSYLYFLVFSNFVSPFT